MAPSRSPTPCLPLLCPTPTSANGETCDLKKDNAATELFQMMDAPSKGFDISVTDPADVTGFLHYMLEAGRRDRVAC